jgi:hypothetical protein
VVERAFDFDYYYVITDVRWQDDKTWINGVLGEW